MTLRPGYALATLALLVAEILIALFVHDRLIRPHGGDVLAVMLVYLGLRAVTPLRPASAALVSLAIAVAIEVGQWFGLVDRLGLGSVTVARVVLGTGFDPVDLVCYAIGAALIWIIDRRWFDRA